MLCSRCGEPLHRYSPDHQGTPDDPQGCINSLRGALEEARTRAGIHQRALETIIYPPFYLKDTDPLWPQLVAQRALRDAAAQEREDA